MALDFTAVTVDSVGELFWSGMLEVHGLSRKWPDACRNKEEPGQEFRSVRRRTDQPSGLVSKIKQNRTGIEDPSLFSAGAIRIDDSRYLAVGIDDAELWFVLFAFAGIDRHQLISQADFL